MSLSNGESSRNSHKPSLTTHDSFYCAAYQSAIIWVFLRGLALFDATVLYLLVFALY